jgi:hypothetical protein
MAQNLELYASITLGVRVVLAPRCYSQNSTQNNRFGVIHTELSDIAKTGFMARFLCQPSRSSTFEVAYLRGCDIIIILLKSLKIIAL